MKHISRLLVSFVLLLPIFAYGGWHDRQGNPQEDTEWMKSSGDFGAQLLLIGDEKEFIKRWETPSKIVEFTTVSEINRGEPLITPVIFSGCQAGESGRCNVSGDFKILRPDGTTYADMPQVDIWQNRPPPPDGILELGVGYIKVIIEPEDPDGTYTVQVRITDHVQNASFVLTRTFTVPVGKADKLPTKRADQETIKDLSQWLTYYYKTPHSDQDIENIKAMFQVGIFDRADSVAPMIMFLAEFFRQNEERLPVWEKELHTIAQDHGNYLLHALWQANTPGAIKLLEGWDDEEHKNIIKKIRQDSPVDLKTVAISSPAHLDMLWATFMASGNTDYVERIISVLALPASSKDKDTRITNMLLVGAAKWSLSSNAVQHELVFNTCQKFAESENPDIKKAIAEVLVSARESKGQQGNNQ
jgi:hypothetical protein